jgi:GT2 family glycosyltransferase
MNRPARLARCVQQILATAGHLDIEVIVVIDCDVASRDTMISMHDARLVVLFNGERRGAIACWNQGLAAATGNILVFFNDDCAPEPGWLDAALEAHQIQLNGYGLVGFNDGYQDGNRLSVQYLFDRQFCRDHLGGVMAYPVYQFYCNDTEANARAKRAGRFVWCRAAVVQHIHWTRPGQTHKDTLDRENSPKAPRDEALFNLRRAHGFPNNFDPVLKGERPQ